MIIVLTHLGLTTNDLNSTLDSYATGSKPPLSFRSVGETTTTHSFYGDRSLHGTDATFMNNLKHVSGKPSPTDSSDTAESKYDHTTV